MKKIAILISLVFIGFACNTSEGETTSNDSTGESEELAKLRSENRELKNKLEVKDSVINESFMLFNEIEQNLAMIDLKEDEIRFRTHDIELEEDGKQWVLQEIQNINYLREANQKKVKELNKTLEDKNLQIEEFQTLVSNLMNKIEVQEEEIEMLRVELADLDREYVELLEAYQEQTEITAEVLQELNTVYYVYGSTEELIKNGVIVKEGGFLGIAKKNTLKSDFNEDYFTEISKSGTNTIDIYGKEVNFITDHPSTSYTVTSEGDKHTISINDHQSFWKVSKYLVVVVD
ncbi:MAG: hypothetical protein MK078_12765 [Crocinitomicaceae bacterium]|nr:hypothetical protein [Crocinitomicaceae bacterium]